MIISHDMNLGQLAQIVSDHVTVSDTALRAFRALIAARFDGRDTADILSVDWLRAIDAVQWDESAEDFEAVTALAVAGLAVGDYVEAGEGEGHDAGRIVEAVSTNSCSVAWSSGVRTNITIADLIRI